ncbi:LysR substrate-binding domain-containing protein [Cupriavidus sp. CV2]|uniref:LysR family transcriptional regulator n=1 Tax=Cupriavidus ulmosensis TaxID=3065913 RepID=UPI00296B2C7B|nr:LysR substrate-binding domain-containing protein [Cupriavidus sp. CV2]MDW3682782.1 LysR substrate-binding domain-containing protein [Cupriavidus sp. CV2]
MDVLWAMKVFVRVAETGSFSRAAETLDVANPTVTTSVRNLERHLHVTLIDRTTRRFRLTEQGQRYLVRAREALDTIARAEEEARLTRGELSGPLYIETTIGLGQVLVSPQLPAFAKRYPEITVAVWLSNQPQNLIEQAIDVALRIGRIEEADVVARPVCELQYMLCGAPDVAAKLPANPADLDPRWCIGNLSEERHSVRPWRLSHRGETVELRPNGPLHFNSGADELVAAKAGMGVACVFDILAHQHIQDGTLVQVYPEWCAVETKTLYVVIPKSRVGSAKVRAFTDFIFEILESQPRTSNRQVKRLR